MSRPKASLDKEIPISYTDAASLATAPRNAGLFVPKASEDSWREVLRLAVNSAARPQG
jgi:hypothetical protein